MNDVVACVGEIVPVQAVPSKPTAEPTGKPNVKPAKPTAAPTVKLAPATAAPSSKAPSAVRFLWRSRSPTGTPLSTLDDLDSEASETTAPIYSETSEPIGEETGFVYSVDAGVKVRLLWSHCKFTV